MASVRAFPFDKMKCIVRSPIQCSLEKGEKISVPANSWKFHDVRRTNKAADHTHTWWDGNLKFENIYCDEHCQWELVLSYNIEEFNYWYRAGLHPRFPTFKILVEDFKQNLWEATRGVFEGIMHTPNLGSKESEEKRKKELHEVLKHCKTPALFKKFIAPFVFVNFYGAGRRHRVRGWWKEKFKNRSFTVDNFFSVQNQELRRYMLRRGVEIKDVLAKMTKISEDAEGSLYLIGNKDAWDRRTYLHVKCPSTGQDYLLEVPNNMDTPSQARRWTFNLEPDAEFVKEA